MFRLQEQLFAHFVLVTAFATFSRTTEASCDVTCSTNRTESQCICTNHYQGASEFFSCYGSDSRLGDGSVCLGDDVKGYRITLHLLGGTRSKVKAGDIFPNPNKAAILVHLYLGKNQIQTIEDNSFVRLSKLVVLDLSSNFVEEVTTMTFEGLGELHRLVLSDNKIQNLVVKGFIALSKLEYLDLSGNPLKGIASHAFFGLTSLRTLKLRNCQLKQISYESLYGPSALQILDLAGNLLSDLPSLVFPHLWNIHLSRNPILTLREYGFSCLKKLQTIHMENTLISKIDNCAFCGLPYLEQLYFGNNKNLTEVRESAFGLHLARLGEMQNLGSLRDFDLRSSGLEYLPEGEVLWDFPGVHIEGNPFRCDCRFDWLINTTREIKSRIICAQPPQLAGIPFAELQPGQVFCIEPNTTETLNVTLGAQPTGRWVRLDTFLLAGGVSIVIFVIMCSLLVYFEYRIKMLSRANHVRQNAMRRWHVVAERIRERRQSSEPGVNNALMGRRTARTGMSTDLRRSFSEQP